MLDAKPTYKNWKHEENMRTFKEVVIYTKDYCPYCVRVKNYLNSQKIDFKQIRVDEDPKLYEELKSRTNHLTVPQIFVDGKFIGGANEFFSWIIE